LLVPDALDRVVQGTNKEYRLKSKKYLMGIEFENDIATSN